MAKSIDRCVVGDCSNVPMKGSDECFACFNETFVELMSGDSCACGRAVTSPRLKVCNFCWSVLQYEILQSFVDDGEDSVVDRMVKIIEDDLDVVKLFKCQRCKAWLEEDDLEGHDEDCDIGGLELDDLSDWRDFELSPEGQAFADKADEYEVNKCSGDGESYDFRAEDFDLSVKTEGSISGENVLCDGCGKEECFCSFIDLVESDWAESVAEQEEELTDCTQSCKEMGMMSEGCDFCQ